MPYWYFGLQYKPSSGASSQPLKKVCITNRNNHIGQFCLKQFSALFRFISFWSYPPLGSVCRLYFVSFVARRLTPFTPSNIPANAQSTVVLPSRENRINYIFYRTCRDTDTTCKNSGSLSLDHGESNTCGNATALSSIFFPALLSPEKL